MTEKNLRSDNVAGIAPEIMAALVAANSGAAAAYGGDPYTAGLRGRFSTLFGTEVAAVQPVATGTACNALALSLLTPPFGAIFCSDVGHISDSECGAGEFFTGGAKIVQIPSTNAKLDPEVVDRIVGGWGKGQTHKVQPAALSITQANERGVLYSLDEVRALTAVARRHGLRVHMDGARFSNAVAALGCDPGELTWQSGVDVLSFGATKNGALAAEAVVVFNPALAPELPFRARRAGQVFSKMRFISAQLDAYVQNGLWLTLAKRANDMGALLGRRLAEIPGVEVEFPVDINELFFRMPAGTVSALMQEGFVVVDRGNDQARIVTAFNTTEADVDAMAAAIARLAAPAGAARAAAG